MSDPLDNVNEVMKRLEGSAISTSQGSFVRVDDVKRLLQERKEEAEKERQKRMEQRPPKTFAEARTRAKDDPEIQAAFPPSDTVREPGRHVDAQPRPSSRT